VDATLQPLFVIDLVHVLYLLFYYLPLTFRAGSHIDVFLIAALLAKNLKTL
jgi:hypothetical protein